MINVISRLLTLTIALASLVCLGGSDSSPATLHQIMVQLVAPQAQIVWNVGNASLDNDGNLDASKVSKAQWDSVLNASQQLKAGAHTLAYAKPVVAAVPGEKLQNEGNNGGFGANDVQRFLDANPQRFRAHARELEGAADKLIKAATLRDGATFISVSNNLDEVCESCHKVFWYPKKGQ